MPECRRVVSRSGRQAGQLVAVHNITVDKGGNIYTAEVNTGQPIQKFRRLDIRISPNQWRAFP